jgi:hypothetical protein
MLISANNLAVSLIGKTDYIELDKFVFGIWIRYLEARPACVQSPLFNKYSSLLLFLQ